LEIRAIAFIMLLFGSLLLVPSQVLAKSSPLELQWSNTYKDYFASSIVQIRDGGFAIAGSNVTVGKSGSFTLYTHNQLLMKINSGGKTEWLKIYQGLYGSTSMISQMPDSGFLLMNYYDRILLKTNSQGNLEWNRTHTDLWRVSGFAVAEDGSYVMVGYDSSSGYNFAVVLKYSVEGDLLWQKTFIDGNTNVRIMHVLLSGEGDGYYVSGSWGMSGWFAKLDLDGKVIWSHIYDYVDKSRWSLLSFNLFVPSLDGGFILGGYDGEFGWVVKVDGKGNELWYKRCGSEEDRLTVTGHEYYISDMVELVDGRFLVFNRLGIICLDTSGEELWFEPYSTYIKTLENASDYVVRNVGAIGVIDVDGCLVVAVNYRSEEVSVHSGSSGYSLWVAKFALEPLPPTNNSSSDRVMLLFGVVAILVVVVLVFVGFWFLKNKKVKGC